MPRTCLNSAGRPIAQWRGRFCKACAAMLAAVLLISGGGFDWPAEARSKSKAKRHGHHHQSHRHHVRKHKPARVAAQPSNTAVQQTGTVTGPKTPVLSRQEILNTDTKRLSRLGQHLIVGYHSFAEVKALVEAQAIAGIFITDHNVKRRSVAAIKADIDTLQGIRAVQGLPPLIVAADQEGGSVSRLSPPLKRQRSLGFLLRGLKTDAERQAVVEAYADAQAAELKRLGVSLNFAPVVDLKLDVASRRDGETRLRERAIDANPYTVAKVAGWYCDRVARAGVMCTLKHFPGLGRVKRDTHVTSGEITATEGKLELNDWVPFRRVMHNPAAAVMLGHVKVGVIDQSAPASYSKAVIQQLIRTTWRYDGLLITDDFSMGAITRSAAGVGEAAVKALNAGADLVLVSYLERHFNAVMSALIAADVEGRFDKAKGEKSSKRIARVLEAAFASAE